MDVGRLRPGTASWPSLPSVAVHSDPGWTGRLTSLLTTCLLPLPTHHSFRMVGILVVVLASSGRVGS